MKLKYTDENSQIFEVEATEIKIDDLSGHTFNFTAENDGFQIECPDIETCHLWPASKTEHLLELRQTILDAAEQIKPLN